MPEFTDIGAIVLTTHERRAAERRSHPLRTLGNLIYAGATVLAFIFLWLLAALLASTIVKI